jgi:hypothetical protein
MGEKLKDRDRDGCHPLTQKKSNEGDRRDTTGSDFREKTEIN